MAYEFKLSTMRELINFAEGHLGLDIAKMNDHDLETVAYIMYQERNVMYAIDDQPVSKEQQSKIDELIARAKKEERK